MRALDDAAAYMALVLANAQGELHPLEEGKHALGSGMKVREYADRVGKAKSNIDDRRRAAEVSEACPDIRTADKKRHWQSLGTVHAAPSWLWPALAAELVARGWTNSQKFQSGKNTNSAKPAGKSQQSRPCLIP